MPEEITETIAEEPQKEIIFTPGTLEIDGEINLPVHIRHVDGVAIALVDDSNTPLDKNIEINNLIGYPDKVTLDAIFEFFDDLGIMCEGEPWTTEDQDDIPGHLSISGYGLNHALSTKALVIKQDEHDPDYWSIEGLSDAIEEYRQLHQDDPVETEDFIEL